MYFFCFVLFFIHQTMFYFCQKCELWLDLLYELNKATRLTSFELIQELNVLFSENCPPKTKNLQINFLKKM